MVAGNPISNQPTPAHLMRRRSTDRAPSQGNLPVRLNHGHAASTSYAYTRPDPSFVTHLIATAEHSPQTRTLRRAESADVDAIYRAATSDKPTGPAGKTRAVV